MSTMNYVEKPFALFHYRSIIFIWFQAYYHHTTTNVGGLTFFNGGDEGQMEV